MPRPVIVAYSKGALAGAEYEVASAAAAKKAHPDAKIVRFADTGEDFAEDAPRTEAAARKAAKEIGAATSKSAGEAAAAMGELAKAE